MYYFFLKDKHYALFRIVEKAAAMLYGGTYGTKGRSCLWDHHYIDWANWTTRGNWEWYREWYK
jgi:hypothetical protein